jgi:hypothetical protein
MKRFRLLKIDVFLTLLNVHHTDLSTFSVTIVCHWEPRFQKRKSNEFQATM